MHVKILPWRVHRFPTTPGVSIPWPSHHPAAAATFLEPIADGAFPDLLI
jgi:hypothetical protein